MENRLESSASTALSRFPREAFCWEEAPEIRISEILLRSIFLDWSRWDSSVWQPSLRTRMFKDIKMTPNIIRKTITETRTTLPHLKQTRILRGVLEPLEGLLEPRKTSWKRAVPTLKTLKNHWFSLNFGDLAALGSLARLGSILEASGRHPGASWRHIGESWRRLGASWRRLGASWSRLGAVLERPGASWRRLEASWRPLANNLARRLPLLEASWSVFERLEDVLEPLLRMEALRFWAAVWAAENGIILRLESLRFWAAESGTCWDGASQKERCDANPPKPEPRRFDFKREYFVLYIFLKVNTIITIY